MDPGEREALLSLVPYFDQGHRVIVDAGSNKGDWSDMIIHNVDEAHLFEPNIKLLHYTEIRFCQYKHVKYYPYALYDVNGMHSFNCLEDEHNGISTLIDHNDWQEFPVIKKEIETRRLDSFEFDHIDFLKIDVEGVENNVLKGAENLLKEGKIKFIQFEYGHTDTKDLLSFITQYGYQLYEYDGRFRKAVIKNNERTNLYLMQEFTENWNQEFIKNTKGMKFNFALEIGCFEGLTTCYICDFLLNPGGRIICVDPLADQYLTENLDDEAKEINKSLKQFKGQYDRFIRNTKGKPVELKRMTSSEVFKLEGFNAYKFDFIYIDGDHRERSVYSDAVGAWEVLAQGGYLLFDDYNDWGDDTHRGINRFLRKYKKYLKVIIKDYQLMVQKNVIQ